MQYIVECGYPSVISRNAPGTLLSSYLPQVEGNRLTEDGVRCVLLRVYSVKLLCLAVTLYPDSELSNLAKIDHF